MPPFSEHRLNSIFAALSDQTRRAIIRRLARGESTVGDLASGFDISLPAVSRHLRVLEEAGFLQRTIHGRVHHCRLCSKPLDEIDRWIDFHRRFWESRLDTLEKFLDTEQDRKP